MAAFTAVYDACVLYPAPLRDLLMQLATTGLFRAKWADAIHAEWMRNVLKNRSDITRDQLERTKHLMNTNVMDCLVSEYEHLIEAITLPDADDRHVVAAAVFTRADAIITFNLRDFPAGELKKHNLEAIHPDEFVSYQFDLDEAKVIVSASKCRARLRNPKLSSEEYISMLEAQQLPKTAASLRKYAEIL